MNRQLGDRGGAVGRRLAAGTVGDLDDEVVIAVGVVSVGAQNVEGPRAVGGDRGRILDGVAPVDGGGEIGGVRVGGGVDEGGHHLVVDFLADDGGNRHRDQVLRPASGAGDGGV